MILLSILALLLLGLAVVLVGRAIVLPTTKASETVRAIESYGFGGVPLAAASASQRPALSALASAIGSVLERRSQNLREEGLRREIMAAGLYRLTPSMLLGYRVLGFAVGAVLGVLAARSQDLPLAVVMVVVASAAGWMLPLTFVRRRAEHRLGLIERGLPDLVDLLVVTVEAGLGLAASMQFIGRKIEGPLGDEIRLTLQEQRMGRGFSESLQGMVTRADTPSMRSFVRSITQAEALGVSIGDILRGLADESRKRRRQSAEEQAQKAPVKMLFPLVFLIFPALFVVLLGPAIFSIAQSLT